MDGGWGESARSHVCSPGLIYVLCTVDAAIEILAFVDGTVVQCWLSTRAWPRIEHDGRRALQPSRVRTVRVF